MAQKKTTTVTTRPAAVTNRPAVVTNRSVGEFFDRQNLILMGIGIAIIALGMFLMAGGKSPDPAVFNEKEVYSTTRIKIAPMLIIIGLVIEVIAIFRRPRVDPNP